MSGSRKETLETQETASEATENTREVYLRDGKKLVIDESGSEALVEIRSDSGMLEVRIKLTAEGPVLQMETVRMQLKATEAVEIEGKRVDIKATDAVAVAGKTVEVTAEDDVEVEGGNDVRVVGKMIYLN